jgi:hypothetical protein
LCEAAHNRECEGLLSERGREGEIDVARELDALEAAAVDGRRAQVRALGCCARPELMPPCVLQRGTLICRRFAGR